MALVLAGPDGAGQVQGARVQEELLGQCRLPRVGVGDDGEGPAAGHLAGEAGIAAGGGVLVDDGCATSDPHILAVGEVARLTGECLDWARPGRAMAEVAAERLLGHEVRCHRDGTAAQRRIAGVDVAYFGDSLEERHEETSTMQVSPSAGVLTPAHLVVIGRLAEVLGLRPSLAGDRIELHGVRPDHLPSLRDRLTAEGLVGVERLPEKDAPPVPDRRRGHLRPAASELRGSPRRVESPA